MAKGVNVKKSKKPQHKYIINCTEPKDDGVIEMPDFESFLKSKIKVDGKIGNLANAVVVAVDHKSIVVTTSIPFSKRYLKYLTKKYLKKQEMKEYLRVISTNKNTYEVKFINAGADADDQE